MVTRVDFDDLPTIWCRDRYPWDPGTQWQSICEHEAQYPLRAGAAQAIAGFLKAPAGIAGIHYSVDASEVWRGTDQRSRPLGRSPHNYRPGHWSVGIEHTGYTVPGNYDGEYGEAMLRVSATLHAALIDEWEARPENASVGRKFPLVVLDLDGIINQEPGLFSHDLATQACKQAGWPEEGHYDGRYYPYDRLIAMIEEIRGTKPPTPPQEDDMPQVHTFFPPGSTPQANGLQPFVEVEWATGQVHGWHGVAFTGADADEALNGDLRTVDFVKLNAGQPIRDFRIDEDSGQIVGFGQGGGIFRVTAVAG